MSGPLSPPAILATPTPTPAGEPAPPLVIPTEEPKRGSGVEPPKEEPKTKPPAEEQPKTEPPAKEEPKTESPSVPTPSSAQAEDFAEQPADVLLTYETAASPIDASQCVGLEASGKDVAFGGVDEGSTPDTIKLELVPGGAMPAKVQCPAAASGTNVLTVTSAAPAPGGVVDDPIDPKYLTEVPFGDSSFWIQPWRSSMTTWPGSRLLNSLGINFLYERPNEAENTAQLLQESDFKQARVEIAWNALSYEDPDQFSERVAPEITATLTALHNHDIRPLILLNSDSGGPTPNQTINLTTLTNAPAGATSVVLDPASASKVVPGKTGFNDLGFGGMADVLITSVSPTDVATLSRPLAKSLPAGEHAGATLLYAPFGPPKLSNGQPNPAFAATLQGWLNYVAAVTKEANRIYGPGGYDLEIWNELSFGSQFLSQANYYSPVREEGTGEVTEAILDETVAYLRSPASEVSPEVGITDGFASQEPFTAAKDVPAGITAISKHDYRGLMEFPSADVASAIKPIDALGGGNYLSTKGWQSIFTPLFVPTYDSFFPEYFLTATQTETLIRDISPITTSIYGDPHGRNVTESNGVVPETWMTEYNLVPSEAKPVEPDETTPANTTLTPADERHLETKALLRHLVSMVGEGLGRDYFFAAAHQGDLDLISQSFISAVEKRDASYPGDEAGGETMTAFRRMLATFQGPGPEGEARQLQLLSIAQEGNHAQFAGDGTAAHPDLYDREVLGVFPFQTSPTRFVIPVYVMTRNLATLYEPWESSTDVNRYDLPSENFRITLGNLPETAGTPTVSAYDPIRYESTPARLVSRQGDSAVFELSATDYPRLLTIDYTGK